MRALTVCQPYPTLILEGIKRVENRTWETKYRGRMYLHAGRDRSWLSLEMRDGVEFEVTANRPVEQLAFGAVVGIVTLIDCVAMEDIEAGRYDVQYPWLRTHEHAIGPWCWIFAENPTPIGPWPWKGRQGLFDIHPADLERVANRVLADKKPGRSFQDTHACGPDDVADFDQ